MSYASSPVARRGRALVATRPRRLALWAGVAVVFCGVGGAYGAFALVQAPPDAVSRLLLDLAAVGAVAAAYALLGYASVGAPSDGAPPEASAPIRALWTPLLVGLGLIGLELGLSALDPGRLVAGTYLPDRPLSVFIAVLMTGGQAVFAVVLAHSLRPLVLHRRRRTSVLLWWALLGSALVSALAFSATPPTEPPPPFAIAANVVTFALALACAFRQGWVVSLTLRQKAAATLCALGLAAVAVGLLVLSNDGPGTIDAMDGGTVVERVPYGFVISRPLGVLFTSAAVFGVLYALTAALVLLFQLPTADGMAQRAGERRALGALAALAGRVLDPSELAEAVARGPVEAKLADAAWLALSDARHGSLAPRVMAAHGLGAERADAVADAPALAEAALRGGPLVLGHASADHRVHARPGTGIGSLAVFPLAAGGQDLGALFVSRSEADAFAPDDVAALETFAAQAALTLSHAQLFADALERDRLVRELALAREVQRRLLPQTLPRIPGLEMAAAERPAAEVGGDYYDAVRLGEDCVGVIVADVSGKGTAAAFHMAEMKGVFQAASRLTRAPGEFLDRANEALRSSLGRGSFVSALYGVLDGDKGTLSLARAGHCPAVLSCAQGPLLLRPAGLAIGMDAGPLFRKTLEEQTVSLGRGDVVVLFTDGLVEARGADGEEYGYDRLAEAVHRLRAETAPALRDRLLAEHRAFTGPDVLADDLTLVVLRWDGPPGTPDALLFEGKPSGEASNRALGEGVPPGSRTVPLPYVLRPAFPDP